MQTEIRIELRRTDHALGTFTVNAMGFIQTKDQYDYITERAFQLFGALGGCQNYVEPTECANDAQPE